MDETVDGNANVDKVNPNIKSAMIGPKGPNRVCKWEGEMKDTPFCNNKEEPYANLFVFQFWDMAKALTMLTNVFMSIIGYRLTLHSPVSIGIFDYDKTRAFFAGDHGGDSGDVFIGLLLGIAAQVGFFIEMTILLMQVNALRKNRPGIIYKCYRALHKIYWRGKPPFCPIDSRSGISQNVYISCGAIMYGFAANSLLPLSDSPQADAVMLGLLGPFTQGIFVAGMCAVCT